MKLNPFLFITAFVLCLFGARLTAQPTMYVHETNATQTAYPLDSIRKLTFPAGVMQVHRVIGDTIAYSFGNIRYVDFSGLSTDVNAPVVFGSTITSFPNPVSDELHLQYYAEAGTNNTFELLDIQGRVILQQQVSAMQSGINQATISVSELAAGSYICRMRNQDQIQSVKFIKN